MPTEAERKALSWTQTGRHHSAQWSGGVLQIANDGPANKPWHWVAFERGAIIGQGFETELEQAKGMAASALPLEA